MLAKSCNGSLKGKSGLAAKTVFFLKHKYVKFNFPVTFQLALLHAIYSSKVYNAVRAKYKLRESSVTN